ncbi:MAG: hypothetical protein LBT89_08475, partial [Planctomycetaceae bacterium]|nr:hypothetical protein [Planctomycetaceae bacterium]
PDRVARYTPSLPDRIVYGSGIVKKNTYKVQSYYFALNKNALHRLCIPPVPRLAERESIR